MFVAPVLLCFCRDPWAGIDMVHVAAISITVYHQLQSLLVKCVVGKDKASWIKAHGVNTSHTAGAVDHSVIGASSGTKTVMGWMLVLMVSITLGRYSYWFEVSLWIVTFCESLISHIFNSPPASLTDISFTLFISLSLSLTLSSFILSLSLSPSLHFPLSLPFFSFL